jgi:hypothetical protein
LYEDPVKGAIFARHNARMKKIGFLSASSTPNPTFSAMAAQDHLHEGSTPHRRGRSGIPARTQSSAWPRGTEGDRHVKAKAMALAVGASFVLIACTAAAPTASPAPTPTVAQSTPPAPSPSGLPPEGTWQVELTTAELVAAGWPADITPAGIYKWSFEGDRAALELDADDGSLISCTADMTGAGGGFRLTYEQGGECAGFDDIGWLLADDGLHLSLISTSIPEFEDQQKAYLETKPWQRVDDATPTAANGALRYVALGDSWPAGEHCDGCRTFVGLWADQIAAVTSREVDLVDLTGWREPGLGDGGETSSTLLSSIRTNETTRDAISDADVILISSGGNEIGPVIDEIRSGSCGGADGEECVRELGETWRTNYEAILDEVDELRAGRPTVLRFVNDENAFVSHPEFTVGLPEGFATGTGARIFQLLYDRMCEAAANHGGACVDVRPIINGPSLDQAGDENSDQTMRAIADALSATGLSELGLHASQVPGEFWPVVDVGPSRSSKPGEIPMA